MRNLVRAFGMEEFAMDRYEGFPKTMGAARHTDTHRCSSACVAALPHRSTALHDGRRCCCCAGEGKQSSWYPGLRADQVQAECNPPCHVALSSAPGR